MTDYNKQISEWLIEKRKERGLTQAQLGEKVGVTKTAISYWEKGKRVISADKFIDICKALNVNPQELIDELLKG